MSNISSNTIITFYNDWRVLDKAWIPGELSWSAAEQYARAYIRENDLKNCTEFTVDIETSRHYKVEG